MTPNTPQLDSEELRRRIDEILTYINADPTTSNYLEYDQRKEVTDNIMQAVQADRAAFADRVLAVLPEKNKGIGYDDATIAAKDGFNSAIDQVTTAITNLVAAPTSGDRGETE